MARHEEAQADPEGIMKMGAAPTAADKPPRGPGLPPSSTHTPQRNTCFENESRLEVNRLVVVIASTLLINCPKYIETWAFNLDL